MVNLSTKILNSYQVPNEKYCFFDVTDDGYSIQKEGDYYLLYYMESDNIQLIISSKNIKFVFSYLVMNAVPVQYKYEARKKFINKIKMEEKVDG